MVYFKISYTKSISKIPDPPQVDVGARRADVLVPILSQGFHKGDADNFFAYRVILLVRAVKP